MLNGQWAMRSLTKLESTELEARCMNWKDRWNLFGGNKLEALHSSEMKVNSSYLEIMSWILGADWD